jgi:hypothetical protein
MTQIEHWLQEYQCEFVRPGPKVRLGSILRGGCPNVAPLGAAPEIAILQRGSGVLQRGSVELEPTWKNFYAGGEG